MSDIPHLRKYLSRCGLQVTVLRPETLSAELMLRSLEDMASNDPMNQPDNQRPSRLSSQADPRPQFQEFKTLADWPGFKKEPGGEEGPARAYVAPDGRTVRPGVASPPPYTVGSEDGWRKSGRLVACEPPPDSLSRLARTLRELGFDPEDAAEIALPLYLNDAQGVREALARRRERLDNEAWKRAHPRTDPAGEDTMTFQGGLKDKLEARPPDPDEPTKEEIEAKAALERLREAHAEETRIRASSIAEALEVPEARVVLIGHRHAVGLLAANVVGRCEADGRPPCKKLPHNGFPSWDFSNGARLETGPERPPTLLARAVHILV